MKIISLEAENVKCVKAVRIEPDPDGHLVVIGGPNGAGKTTVLDCIEMVLGGMSSASPEPVRKGKRKAKIIAKLDGLTVRRTINTSGNVTLEVKNDDGEKLSSPQAILDKMVGSLSFDPLSFARMAPRDQIKELCALVGLDLSDLDQKRQELYDDRRDAGREVKRLEGVSQSMTRHRDAPKETSSATELIKELESIRTNNREWEEHVEATSAADDELRFADKQLEEAKARKAKAVKSLKAAQKAEKEFEEQAEGDLVERISRVEEDNAKVRENTSFQKAKKDLDAARLVQEEFGEDIKAIDAKREKRLSDAKFPVEGLGFDEKCVTMGGLPFEQASTAERLRVSVAMGLAANPKLKVLLIRDASALDDNGLVMIAEMAAEADAQVWMERVGDGEEVTVLIKDGEVVED